MENILHQMPEETEGIQSPPSFTYPYYYQPHPLCVAAVEDIKTECRRLLKGEEGGKMFGVLVVERTGTHHDNEEGRRDRYYLAAFSGIIQGTYHHEGFVPPIYDLQQPTSYFQSEQVVITEMNRRIREGNATMELYEERKERSRRLQWWLFQQFHVLNAKGEEKELTDIFKDEKPILSTEEYYARSHPRYRLSKHLNIPPSGAGECCAPKLLQYAYSHKLKPVCMAEFWLGPSPKDEIRIDGNYYPACQSKCRPILSHMLKGLDVEDNPLLDKSRKLVSKVEYLYEDDDIVVMYKPSGLLTAPGKNDVPSLLDVVKKRHPEAAYVHRLDMDTSGLVVFALHFDAYKHLQEQFVRHEVKKRYVAILDGEIDKNLKREGTISLPLLPNPYDRPRQMVDREHGKQAITHYRILSVGEGMTKVEFEPQTGRTHQLRVHSAHHEGLGIAIKGDNLYGKPSDKLYLHAEEIEFTHPTTGKRIRFRKEEIVPGSHLG